MQITSLVFQLFYIKISDFSIAVEVFIRDDDMLLQVYIYDP